jgi:hypothetical protein
MTQLQHRPARAALRRWESLWLQKRRRRRRRAVGQPAVPVAPGNLIADANGGVLVVLQWDDRSVDEQGFRIYRQVDGGGYGLWQTVGAGASGAEDPGVVSGHVYAYYVTAFNAAGESGPSNEVEVTIP